MPADRHSVSLVQGVGVLVYFIFGESLTEYLIEYIDHYVIQVEVLAIEKQCKVTAIRTH